MNPSGIPYRILHFDVDGKCIHCGINSSISSLKEMSDMIMGIGPISTNSQEVWNRAKNGLNKFIPCNSELAKVFEVQDL